MTIVFITLALLAAGMPAAAIAAYRTGWRDGAAGRPVPQPRRAARSTETSEAELEAAERMKKIDGFRG